MRMSSQYSTDSLPTAKFALHHAATGVNSRGETLWSRAGRYGASGSGPKKPQAGTPVLRGGAFPGVQAPGETVGKGRFPIFETTSGVVLSRARILTWHPATLRFGGPAV